MKAPTHIAFGLFVSSIAGSFSASYAGTAFGFNKLTLAAIAGSIMGALLPDIDHRQSCISRILPPLSRLICKRFSHRTLLHSFLGLGIIVTILLLWAIGFRHFLYRTFGINIAPASTHAVLLLFSVSYFSHLILDTMTRRGIMYLYPLHVAFGYPSPEKYRFITGDMRAEIPISAISLALFLAFIPITRQGAQLSLLNLIGKTDQLIDIYTGVAGKEVLIHFNGYQTSNKTPVSGCALILAASMNGFTVYWQGDILTLGEGADIHLLRGTCEILDIPPVERTSTYHNTPLSDILEEANGHVLISGRLDSNRPFDVRKPYASTISVSASSVDFSFANRADIEALRVRQREKDMAPDETVRKQHVLDSLVQVRQRSKDLYERDRLFDEISETRKELKTLDKKLASPVPSLLFSGILSFRRIPAIPDLLQ